MMTTTVSMRVRNGEGGPGSPPEETGMALEAALGRIARLEKTLAELLLKNERLRQELGGVGIRTMTMATAETSRRRRTVAQDSEDDEF